MLKKLLVITLLTFISSPSIAAIKVQDSRGSQTLAAYPQRVAALNWDIAEQVIELGITPIAVPDIKGYNEWVVKPEIAGSVQDIGTRVEPNLERLAELKPDLIIVASPQYDLIPRLQQIAPVLYYQTYDAKHDNALAALKNYQLMAQALGKEALAEKKLAHMQEQIQALKAQLNQAYAGDLPKVATFRFVSATSMYLYGDNSIAQYALKQLGIEPALPQQATQWGLVQKRLKLLNELPQNSVALYYKPFDQQAMLEKSVLWQAMPVVREGRVGTVEAVWSYGGAMSILYNAQALTEALLALAEKK